MEQDLKTLVIIHWPDPRLKAVSKPVQSFDAGLGELAARMFELMRQNKGVGLAAPQVGKNIRMFVMNSNGEPGNDRVYINPELIEAQGEEEAEEGCLSLPEINADIFRSKTITIKAFDLSGKPVEQTETGFVARIWQHETDHLNGILITDRMGPVAKMTSRKRLKELEEKYAEAHPASGRKRVP